jgi:hypothetical protein
LGNFFAGWACVFCRWFLFSCKVFFEMGRQHTKAILVGTCANLNGYIDDGKPLVRMVDLRDRRSAGALVASDVLGRASKVAAGFWRCMPKRMRKLGGEGAYNQFVGVCQELAAEGGYYWDFSALNGLEFSASGNSSAGVSVSLEELRGGRVDLSGALAAVRDSVLPFLGGNEGAWRLGKMPVRDGHFDLGCQIQYKRWECARYEGSARDRDLNALHAAGVFRGAVPEFYDHFETGRFPAELDDFRRPELRGVAAPRGAVRARFWLRMTPVGDAGVTGFCSDWGLLDSVGSRDESRLYVDVSHVGPYLDRYPVDMEWVVFFGVEVAEKRGRHWVRLPFACGLRVDCLQGTGDGLGSSAVCVGRRAFWDSSRAVRTAGFCGDTGWALNPGRAQGMACGYGIFGDSSGRCGLGIRL